MKKTTPPTGPKPGKSKPTSTVIAKTMPDQRQNRGAVRYTRELADLICHRLANGKTLRSICRAPGMPNESAVRIWAIDDKDGFAERYARARILGYEAMADEVIDLADDDTGDLIMTTDKDGNAIEKLSQENVQRSRLRVDARKWLLAKALPKMFGEKTDVTVRDETLRHEPESVTRAWIQSILDGHEKVVPFRNRDEIRDAHEKSNSR